MAKLWRSTGVIAGYLNALAVSANGSGMAVSVATGAAWVEGFYYENDATKSVTITAAHATLPRIDRIVARLDRTANTITAIAVAGTPNASPSAPALTQTSTTWDVPLATVAVGAAVSVINLGNVTDGRTYSADPTLAIYAATVDAKGDLLAGTAADTVARLAVGTAGQVLTVDSAETTGLKWASPTGLANSTGATVTTFESTTSGAYTDLTTVGPTVTVTVGASGRLLLIYTARVTNTSANIESLVVPLTTAGATTVAADDNNSVTHYTGVAGQRYTISRPLLLTSLTPGSYTFKLQYKTGGGTATFDRRELVAIPL